MFLLLLFYLLQNLSLYFFFQSLIFFVLFRLYKCVYKFGNLLIFVIDKNLLGVYLVGIYSSSKILNVLIVFCSRNKILVCFDSLENKLNYLVVMYLLMIISAFKKKENKISWNRNLNC